MMDTRTGHIISTEEALRRNAEAGTAECIGMLVPPTVKQLRRDPARVGRNEPCPCGSGKKFKKCCLRKEGD